MVLVQELDGVQLSNTVYFQIDDLGLDPALSVGLGDIMTKYYQSVLTFCSNKWKLVCGVYENMSNTEAKITVFTTDIGSGTGDSHPQDQVFRFNRYAQKLSTDPIHRGAFNQSGVEEEWSEEGRVSQVSTFNTLRAFLRDQQIMPGPNWTIDPQLRSELTPPPNPTYEYNNVMQAELSSRVFKLARRKTSLCAVG
ncbi:unnamed protein product [marine sediment metagenome]|uniref:Uncharacterized protein n=1 Tax=marine sediment metagenome TaxID=412755 RepID=X1RJY8_9ZZZZ